MELAVELEDDLFFADLSKQISLLIMDEDDEDPVAVCSSVSVQAWSRGSYQAAPSPFLYEQSCRARESKGTGVFIPRSSQPRKKHHHHHHHHRQGKSSSFNTKSHTQYRQQGESTRMVSQFSYSNSASNPKRSYRDAASLSS